MQHNAVRDATATWLAQASAVHVATEVTSRTLECGSIRADVVASAPVAGGTAVIEIKTVDMRCQTRAGSTVARESARLETEIARHYGDRAAPLVLSHAGAHTRNTADTIARLQAMRQNSAPHLADAPTLLAHIGKACVQAEAGSFADWCDRVQSVRVATSLVPACTQSSSRCNAMCASEPSPTEPPGHDVQTVRFGALTQHRASADSADGPPTSHRGRASQDAPRHNSPPPPLTSPMSHPACPRLLARPAAPDEPVCPTNQSQPAQAPSQQCSSDGMLPRGPRSQQPTWSQRARWRCLPQSSSASAPVAQARGRRYHPSGVSRVSRPPHDTHAMLPRAPRNLPTQASVAAPGRS